MQKDERLTIAEAAELLECSKEAIYRFLKSGKLQGTKIGKVTLIHKKSVEKILTERLASGTRQSHE